MGFTSFENTIYLFGGFGSEGNALSCHRWLVEMWLQDLACAPEGGQLVVFGGSTRSIFCAVAATTTHPKRVMHPSMVMDALGKPDCRVGGWWVAACNLPPTAVSPPSPSLVLTCVRAPPACV